MGSYRRLTRVDRITIQKGLEQGKNRAEIAAELGFHRSSVGRELKRNKAVKASYNWRGAQAKAVSAKKQRHEYRRKIEGPLEELVRQKLEQFLSPQQISERLRYEKSEWKLSHETIYKWVYFLAPDYRAYLRWRSRKRQKRSRRLRRLEFKFPKKIITERPESANLRAEIGHWERDLLEGQRSGPALLVIQERKSRRTILQKINSKHAVHVNAATASSLKDQKVLSMTNDNGIEFGCGDDLEKLIKAPVYYCHPYTSWERGSVENVNGLIRQYFPKKTDFSKVTEREIKQVEDALNCRPKKVLGYRTPREVHDGQTTKLIRSDSYYRKHLLVREYQSFRKSMIREVGYFLEIN
jgi:IS30 family transposase